jgi:hypothetical protein
MVRTNRQSLGTQQSAHVIQTWGNQLLTLKQAKPPSTGRVAYSLAEFAALCGRHPSWAYRLLYGGKVRALTDLGRILIPASELERVLSCAASYNPKPRTPKVAQSGVMVGDGE